MLWNYRIARIGEVLVEISALSQIAAKYITTTSAIASSSFPFYFSGSIISIFWETWPERLKKLSFKKKNGLEYSETNFKWANC